MPPTDVSVRWEVSEGPGFRKVVRAGTALAEARLTHSVHVEVDFVLLVSAPGAWCRLTVHVFGRKLASGQCQSSFSARPTADELTAAVGIARPRTERLKFGRGTASAGTNDNASLWQWGAAG